LKVTPQWLPDGEIGFVQKFGDSKGLAFVSGKTGVPGMMRNPSWSPDGKTVVYQKSIDPESQQMLPNLTTQMLPAFSRDSGFSLYRTGNFPAWAPAGDCFVTTVGSQVQMFDSSGRNGRTIYNRPRQARRT